MTDRRERFLGGCLCALIGGAAAAAIYRQPDHLHAPAWVAYAAFTAFVFAGLAIIADGSTLRRTHAWLAVACMAGLLVPGAWVAFGPGVRQCSVSVPYFSTVGSGLLCRGAFGFGAVIVAALLVWAVLRAVRRTNAD